MKDVRRIRRFALYKATKRKHVNTCGRWNIHAPNTTYSQHFSFFVQVSLALRRQNRVRRRVNHSRPSYSWHVLFQRNGLLVCKIISLLGSLFAAHEKRLRRWQLRWVSRRQHEPGRELCTYKKRELSATKGFLHPVQDSPAFRPSAK